MSFSHWFLPWHYFYKPSYNHFQPQSITASMLISSHLPKNVFLLHHITRLFSGRTDPFIMSSFPYCLKKYIICISFIVIILIFPSSFLTLPAQPVLNHHVSRFITSNIKRIQFHFRLTYKYWILQLACHSFLIDIYSKIIIC